MIIIKLLKYFFKNEKAELASFKRKTKAYKSEYSSFNYEDWRLIKSRLEIEIDTLKEDHMLQITGSFFSLLPIILVNVVLALNISVQNHLQTNLKVIDVHLAEYNKNSLQINTSTLIDEIKSGANIVYNSSGDILGFLLKGCLTLIISLLMFLVIREARRLSKISKLSKRLFVINNLIEEHASQNIKVIGKYDDVNKFL